MCRCNWYKVYDFLEAIHSRMTPGEQTHFEAAINACSLERGVGWKLVDGQVVMRGTEAFETVVRKRSAPWRKRTDRRQQAMFTRPCWLSLDVPQADPAGAIYHAMGALEAVARERVISRVIPGKHSARSSGAIQTFCQDHLITALSQLWGYASTSARRAVGTRAAEPHPLWGTSDD